MKKLTDFDRELIRKELDNDFFSQYKYEYIKPSNRWIDWLFNHYYLHEMCENFYDRELSWEEYGGEENWNMWSDYKNHTHYCEHKHSREEMKETYLRVEKLHEDYENRRKEFCNWQEVYGEGIWFMTQEECDKTAKETLKKIRKYGKISDRFFVKKTDKSIHIFFYGRDFLEHDYWMILAKNGVDLWEEARNVQADCDCKGIKK